MVPLQQHFFPDEYSYAQSMEPPRRMSSVNAGGGPPSYFEIEVPNIPRPLHTGPQQRAHPQQQQTATYNTYSPNTSAAPFHYNDHHGQFNRINQSENETGNPYSQFVNVDNNACQHDNAGQHGDDEYDYSMEPDEPDDVRDYWSV